jgi:IS4 transposase
MPAKEIIEIYKRRWDIEVFFKWLKQNMKIKKWIGYNETLIANRDATLSI